MMRFDLIIDDDLRVYLMEANMSPNLSSAHFLQNTLLYEQVIFNIFSLVGVASTVERESFRTRSVETEIRVFHSWQAWRVRALSLSPSSSIDLFQTLSLDI